MITRTTHVGSYRVVVRSANHTAPQLDWLLGFLTDFVSRQARIRDGETIQFGWTMFILRRRENDILVHVPDFERDPFQDTTDDLTVSLEIQAAQNDVLHRLRVDGQATTFQDKIVVAKGVLSERRVYLERAVNPRVGDSGWYVGPVETMTEQPELEAYYVYQLLRIRRGLLSALSIPSGFLVVFDGDRIDAVLDRDDVDRWASGRSTREEADDQ